MILKLKMTTNISSVMLNYIEDKAEIENSIVSPKSIAQTYRECFQCVGAETITLKDKLKIETVVDYLHDILHTGHWSTVSVTSRKAFSAACFLKALMVLKINCTLDCLRDALKCLDLGILLGAPLAENDELLTKCASFISNEISIINDNLIDNNISSDHTRQPTYANIAYDDIKAEEIHSEIVPSLEYFMKHHFDTKIPLVIKGCMSHWPAARKWTNLSYVLKILGERTVPIEVGSQYSDENWSQKLMTVNDFINKYYIVQNEQTGYLAQHNLFDQVPELKQDIRIPEYCCTSRTESDDISDVEINAWFGPGGTISSLHYDPKDNILSQVYGIKQVIMFDPSDSENLYPHGSNMLSNTSQINPLKPDNQKYPKFKNAKMYKCLISAGDMLYIPPKWWHHVVSLEKSFSVNFWWT